VYLYVGDLIWVNATLKHTANMNYNNNTCFYFFVFVVYKIRFSYIIWKTHTCKVPLHISTTTTITPPSSLNPTAQQQQQTLTLWLGCYSLCIFNSINTVYCSPRLFRTQFLLIYSYYKGNL